MDSSVLSGIPRTRPTSLITAREESVPNVMICETESWPYFSLTYLITISRLLSEKSTSMSGMLILSGFRNRSNRRSYLIGSTFVMPREYDATLPAALPRPGPTYTPISRAARMKSWTMRKYPAYPIRVMTPISCSSRSISGCPAPGYLRENPSRVRFSKY